MHVLTPYYTGVCGIMSVVSIPIVLALPHSGHDSVSVIYMWHKSLPPIPPPHLVSLLKVSTLQVYASIKLFALRYCHTSLRLLWTGADGSTLVLGALVSVPKQTPGWPRGLLADDDCTVGVLGDSVESSAASR